MILKIYSDIVDGSTATLQTFFGGSSGVTFANVDEFVNSIPADDDTIELLINCRGGSVSEGWAIVDKLRSTGKKISAVIDGTCASMAVSILLAASERRAQPHATIHIHKPYYPQRSLSGAYNEDDLRRIASDLERETSKMIDWYVERTGADRTELETLMAEDKDIGVEEAIRLGFIQSVVAPMSASVEPNISNQNPSNMAKLNSKAGIINALASFLGVKVNIEDDSPSMVVETADGRSFTISKAEGEPAVGDQAEPDGEYPLVDGRIVVVAEGVISEIRDAAPAEPTEPEPAAAEPTEPTEPAEPAENPLEKENEDLKAQVEELKKQIEELKAKLSKTEGELPTEEIKAMIETVNKCGGSQWLEKVARSTYIPPQRQTNSKTANASAKVDYVAERLAKLKGNQNKK